MISKLPFRQPGRYFTSIDMFSGIALVQHFRQWIGEEFLAERTRAYTKRVATSHSVGTLQIQAKQPLIEAFQQVDRLLAEKAIKPQQITPEIKNLMGVAAKAFAVTPTLTEIQANDHRHKLLNFDGQHAPQLLEWTVASHVIRTHAACLAWAQVGGDSASEFVGLANGIEFEVECKFQSDMTGHVLGNTEADNLAGLILDGLHADGLQGRLRLHVEPAAAPQSTALIKDIKAWMEAGVTIGAVDARFGDRARISGTLCAHDGKEVDAREWSDNVLRDLSPGGRGFQRSHSAGSAMSDPLGLIIFCPLKPMDQLFDELQTKRFDHAARQCSGERGAILVFGWQNVQDPRIFALPGLFKTLMRETFLRHRHVSRISMVCDSSPADVGTLWENSVEAYSETSQCALFPEVNPILALDLPSQTTHSSR
jgi:hypothetical protein